MQPAVITFRPDNLFTVGLLGVVAYLLALFVVQLAMRAGIIQPAAKSQPAAPSPPGDYVATG
jgi:hypothetical protein